MRRLLSFTLALVAGFFVLGVPSAVAGGPTSVLLANYETGRSAAALNGSAAYTELQSILGDESPPAESSTPPGVVKESGAVRLVWLIHDVSPWRIDNVHVVGADVWVETYVDTSGTDPYAGSPTWHQPARGADLVTQPDRPGRPRDGHTRRRWVDVSPEGCRTGRARHCVRAFDVGHLLAARHRPRGGRCPCRNRPGHAAGSSWAAAPPPLPPRRGHGVVLRHPARTIACKAIAFIAAPPPAIEAPSRAFGPLAPSNAGDNQSAPLSAVRLCAACSAATSDWVQGQDPPRAPFSTSNEAWLIDTIRDEVIAGLRSATEGAGISRRSTATSGSPT